MRTYLPRFPRRTLRFRLTALYGGLFLITSAALLAITYVLTYGSTSIAIVTGDGKVLANAAAPGGQQTLHTRGKPTAAELRFAHQAMSRIAQRKHDLHQLLIGSGIALTAVTGLAIVTGWLIAGRVLRPMRMMKTATQQITERSLHERLAVPGPRDEVKDLADTIDDLLARLQAAFEAQRRFVASASHELRTPLTLNRALLEVALADPGASAADLRVTCEDLITAGEQQERLVDALLTLATAEHGLDRADEFDLADIAHRALRPQRPRAEGRGLRLSISLGHAVVRGDPDLTERLAANLIDNAIRYNMPGGSVDVRTETTRDHAVLAIANTGPAVPPDSAGQLFEPFQRLIDDRASHPDGHGLGLSIVRAIADAHNAGLEARPQPDGGLIIRACFPSSSGPRAADEPISALRPASGLARKKPEPAGTRPTGSRLSPARYSSGTRQAGAAVARIRIGPLMAASARGGDCRGGHRPRRRGNPDFEFPVAVLLIADDITFAPADHPVLGRRAGAPRASWLPRASVS